MKLYFEFLKKAFQEQYVYRFNLIVSVIGSFLALWMQIFIWRALFDGNEAAIIDIRQMLTYTIVSSLLMTLTSSSVAHKLGEKIQTGDIIMDFLRPVNLKTLFFANELGWNLFRLLFIAMPGAILTGLMVGFSFPAELEMIFAFSISLILGLLLAFYFHYLVGLSAFWLEATWYIPFFTGALIQLFAGATIPLWFYPEWLYQLTNFMPFRFIFFEPISIFLGQRDISEILIILATQLIWLLILWVCERLVWRNVNAKMVMNGG